MIAVTVLMIRVPRRWTTTLVSSPRTPPKSAVLLDSIRIDLAIYPREAPIARSTPISLLRSITEIMNALNRAIAAKSATIH